MARAAAGVVAQLCRRIVTGELRPGEIAPAGRDIAGELDVTVGAAEHALAMLRQDGLVEHVADGPGLVVTERAPELASAWQAGARHRPARVDAQFLALIVRTAIELADTDGLAGTSMRRIAGELDVEFMTLRKAVRDRAHLELLMADAIFAEHPPPSPTGDWRAQLEVLCHAQLLMYRRHRWLAEAVSFKQPLLSPHVLGHTEWAVRALAAGWPDTAQRLAATAANFVRGHAMRLAQEERDTALFEFGLQRLLDGFAQDAGAS